VSFLTIFYLAHVFNVENIPIDRRDMISHFDKIKEAVNKVMVEDKQTVRLMKYATKKYSQGRFRFQLLSNSDIFYLILRNNAFAKALFDLHQNVFNGSFKDSFKAPI
jgi:hypothetical protein